MKTNVVKLSPGIIWNYKKKKCHIVRIRIPKNTTDQINSRFHFLEELNPWIKDFEDETHVGLVLSVHEGDEHFIGKKVRRIIITKASDGYIVRNLAEGPSTHLVLDDSWARKGQFCVPIPTIKEEVPSSVEVYAKDGFYLGSWNYKGFTDKHYFYAPSTLTRSYLETIWGISFKRKEDELNYTEQTSHVILGCGGKLSDFLFQGNLLSMIKQTQDISYFEFKEEEVSQKFDQHLYLEDSQISKTFKMCIDGVSIGDYQMQYCTKERTYCLWSLDYNYTKLVPELNRTFNTSLTDIFKDYQSISKSTKQNKNEKIEIKTKKVFIGKPTISFYLDELDELREEEFHICKRS
jgi:hypothetical protein